MFATIDHIFLILSVLAALAASLFWLFVYYRRDREEPEPKSLLFLLFVSGMIATVFVIIFYAVAYFTLPHILQPFFIQQEIRIHSLTEAGLVFLVMMTVVGPIEEFLKFVMVRLIAFRSREFTQVTDGIIYAACVALGFAFMENIDYFYRGYYMGGWGGFTGIVIARFLIATILHTLSSGIMGFYLGKAKLFPQKEGRFIILGLLLAMLIHGLYNFLAAVGWAYYALVLVLVLMLILFFKFRHPQKLQPQTQM